MCVIGRASLLASRLIRTASTASGWTLSTVPHPQEYGLRKKIMKFEVDTKLWLDDGGLITRHEDRWRDSYMNFAIMKRSDYYTLGRIFHF
jgi:hypothetical protein